MTAATTDTTSILNFEMKGCRTRHNVYVAYGVLTADGGLSWRTYETVEAARRDDLWRPGAKIVKLHLSVVSEEEFRGETEAEKLSRQLRSAR